MALIDTDNPIATQSAAERNADFLTNLYINRDALQRAIFALTSDPLKSYTYDSGQNTVTASRQDLPSLIERLKTLQDLISQVEEQQGATPRVSGQLVQVAPTW